MVPTRSLIVLIALAALCLMACLVECAAKPPKPPSPPRPPKMRPPPRRPPPPYVNPPPFVPPDTYPPPLAPAPPLFTPNVGHINNLESLCAVCTNGTFNSSCSSRFAGSCIRAMNVYRLEVLRIRQPICFCYGAIGALMVQLCPGANIGLTYIGNCDLGCFYGPECPYNPTAYSLASSTDIALAARSSSILPSTTPNSRIAPPPPSTRFHAAPTYTAAAIINFVLAVDGSSRVCFKILPSPTLPKLAGASINKGVMGSNGPVSVLLFGSTTPSRAYTGCIAAPVPLLRNLSSNSFGYYLVLKFSDSSKGDVRGQILASPHLFSLPSYDNVVPPAQCMNADKTDCKAYVDLQLTPFSIIYTISAAPGLFYTLESAFIGKGRPGVSSAVNVAPLFGPGVAPITNYNGIVPDQRTILEMFAQPTAFYFNATNDANPGGAVIGQLVDRLQLFATLTSSRVSPAPSRPSTGVARFNALVGGGGICFTLALPSDVSGVTAVNIAAGDSSARQGVLVASLGVASSTLSCTALDPDVAGQVLDGPSDYFVIVYTSDNPTGVLRGQLNADYISSVV